MTPATVLGIEITDCASHLVCADVAEERNLVELSAALRNVTRPLVLESTDPPALLPDVTHWCSTWHRAVRGGSSTRCC